MFQRTYTVPDCFGFGPIRHQQGIVVQVSSKSGLFSVYKTIDGGRVKIAEVNLSDCEAQTISIPGDIGDSFDLCYEGVECAKVSAWEKDVSCLCVEKADCSTTIAQELVIPAVEEVSNEGVLYGSGFQWDGTNWVTYEIEIDSTTGAVTIIRQSASQPDSTGYANPIGYNINDGLIYGILNDSGGDATDAFSLNPDGTFTNLGPVNFPPEITSILAGGFRASDGLFYVMIQNGTSAPYGGTLWSVDMSNPSAAAIQVAGFVATGPDGQNQDLVFDPVTDYMYHMNGDTIYEVQDITNQGLTESVVAVPGTAAGALGLIGDNLYQINSSTKVMTVIDKNTGAISVGATATMPQLTPGGVIFDSTADFAEGQPSTYIVTPRREITKISCLNCDGGNICYLEGNVSVELTQAEIAALIPAGTELPYLETATLALTGDTWAAPSQEFRSLSFYVTAGSIEASIDGGMTYKASYDTTSASVTLGQGNEDDIDLTKLILRATADNTTIQIAAETVV